MTAEEIKKFIEQELKSEKDRRQVFGLDLTKCLIEPVKQQYKDANNPAETYELWTVLEETEDGKGYKIYYDEESKMFGLATGSEKGGLLDLGNYGSFLETLYSM
jgi:hypothetical protein